MQDQKAYAKAQRLYSEYVRRHPKDGAVPDVLLRQAYLYRDMGVPELAMSKFFAVMSACLNLQVEEIEYYQKLVLRAQVEIAETCYSLGKYEEASEYLNKVLKLDNSELNRASVLFKLVRCYWNLKNFNGAVANARLYLAKYPDTGETPETRYLLADSLKKLGQDKEAVQEILVLLQKQQARSRTDPQQWLYWQQRAGNDIANQFYQQGDFLKALQVYQSLAAISDSPAWQMPVWYQIGLVFENLRQPPKAAEMYQKIVDRHNETKAAGEAAAEPTETLLTIVEMARWRKEFLDWENKAQAANKQLEPALKPVESALGSAPGT
jgi:tetratricopeptide (TPR) repeat protein